MRFWSKFENDQNLLILFHFFNKLLIFWDHFWDFSFNWSCLHFAHSACNIISTLRSNIFGTTNITNEHRWTNNDNENDSGAFYLFPHHGLTNLLMSQEQEDMSKYDTQLVIQVRRHLFTKCGFVGWFYCDKRKTVLRLQETQSRWLSVSLLSINDNSIFMQRKWRWIFYQLWFMVLEHNNQQK